MYKYFLDQASETWNEAYWDFIDFYWSHFNKIFPAKLIFSSLENEMSYILKFFNAVPKRILARRLKDAIDRYSMDCSEYTTFGEDDIGNTMETIDFVGYFQNCLKRSLTQDETLKLKVLSVSLQRFMSGSS